MHIHYQLLMYIGNITGFRVRRKIAQKIICKAHYLKYETAIVNLTFVILRGSA